MEHIVNESSGENRMRIKSLQIALLSCFLYHTAPAEIRIWTDESGKKIEAEYVHTLGDKVILRQADGSELKVSLDTLSKKDQKYAVLQAPPRIEIKASIDTDRENTGFGNRRSFQVQEESVQCKVEIKKTSPAPYEAPLRVELYLIGKPENKDFYTILEQSHSSFSFTQENEYKYSFVSDPVNLTQIEAGREKGIEYEGYLIVVKDKSGEALSMRASKTIFEKNATALMGSKKGIIFDEDFNQVSREETKENDKQRKKSGKRKIPGRKF
jgi:hypothetical protein